MTKIIGLSNTKDPNDERCSICKPNEPNSTVTIKGSANCHYCGNQINLCKKHFDQLKKEITEINI